MKNLELRVGYLMRSEKAKKFLQEEGGGGIKPNMLGLAFCRGNEVSLERMVEAGGEKWMMRRK